MDVWSSNLMIQTPPDKSPSTKYHLISSTNPRASLSKSNNSINLNNNNVETDV